jgi:hypothetical protein
LVLSCCLLDDADFFIRQVVELVDELIDLFVGRVDLVLDLSMIIARLAGY